MMLDSQRKTLALVALSALLTACPPSTIVAPPPDAQGDERATDSPIAADFTPNDQASPEDAQSPVDRPDFTDGFTDGFTKDSGAEDLGSLPDGFSPEDLPVTPDSISPEDLPITPDGFSPEDLPSPRDVPGFMDGPADAPPADAPVLCPPAERALMLPAERVMATLRGTGRFTAMCATSNGPEHMYTLRVGARVGVMLTTSDASFDTVLSVRRACTDPRSEFVCNDDVPGTNNSRVRTLLDPGDYFVFVDQFGPATGMGGTYALNLSTYTPSPNAECAGALPLGVSAPATGDSRNGGGASAACQTSSDGPQSYYSLTLPAGRRAVLSAATAAGATPPWRPIVRVLSACGAMSCLANGTAPNAVMPATTTVDNRGSTPLNVMVSVASTAGSVGGAFSLAVALSDVPPPPSNTTCRAARVLALPAVLREQSSALGSENATSACLTTATGTVLYYSLIVPARQTLNLRVSPHSSMDPVVRVLSACGATSCLVSENRAGAGSPETASYANTSGADQTVIVAVGGASNASNGSFDLEASVERAYLESSIPTACDVMTGATTLMGLSGDDTHTALIDLPFAFPFFGENQLEHSVTSNGLIQLFPTLVGAGSNNFTNLAIPSESEPNGFIAAFWDDLLPVMGSSVLARVLGTSPERHYTVQWTAFGFYNDNTARLTFQAKLFERSGVIELHYCTLSPGMMAPFATGSSASVGIESSTGRVGRQHSFNTPMSLNTTTAIRFSL